MSMYPWHGTPSTNNHHHHAAGGASGPRIDHSHTGPSPSPSSYQMPQLRWLPSMMSRSQQNTLPTISSNLRMGQNSHHQPVSVVVEARPPQPESSEGEDSDRSDSAARDTAGTDALGDPDYAPSPPGMGQGGVQNGAAGTGGGVVAGGGVTGGGGGGGGGGRGGSGLVAGRLVGDEELEGPDTGETPRKHGKRLTTKEEVSLFDICNRHAAGFGQRSNLCKWWKTVTEEFTRDQGHPYSWHSVRRKVEVVTKQRMKFLEEQREKGDADSDDLSNPRWRAAVDAWIPTWRRWEHAEAQRIEKRDSRRPRKRKDRSFDLWDGASDGWRPSSTPAAENRPQQPLPSASAASPTIPAATTATAATAAAAAAAATASASQNTVRLPPGFDSMFTNQTPHGNRTSGAGGWPYPQSGSTLAPSALEGSMMTVVLETLGKLNRHLDTVSSDPRASPLITSLATTTGAASAGPQSQIQIPGDGNVAILDGAAGSISSAFISQLRDELRQEMQDEMRRELEKDRASLEEKLDSVQRTQEMILEMLRQEPS